MENSTEVPTHQQGDPGGHHEAQAQRLLPEGGDLHRKSHAGARRQRQEDIQADQRRRGEDLARQLPIPESPHPDCHEAGPVCLAYAPPRQWVRPGH